MSSSKKPLSLFLTSMTPAIWNQFYSWYEQRKEDHRPHMPPCGIWVVTDEFIEVSIPGGVPVQSPKLIAGCCLYPANGPYVICEFVSTNPEVSARVRHVAAERIGWAIRVYGAIHGQTPMTFPKHKGVKRLLKKTGFLPVKAGVEVMWAQQFAPVHFEPGQVAEAPSATMESANAAE